MMETKIAIFRGKEIRKTIHKDEWWFVVEDVALALIDSKDPKQYIQRMKQRDPELGKEREGTNCTYPFNRDGRRRSADALRQHRRHIGLCGK
jgi:prophage antirepressor-like protein